MEENKKNDKKLETKDKLQKNTAKIWLSVLAVIIVIAVVWALGSHL